MRARSLADRSRPRQCCGKGRLYLTTPKDVVLAVDAATGKVRWTFDPGVKDEDVHYIVTSRGVALWHDARRGACSDRVIVATLDRRLIALDAREGKPCAGFGSGGTVDLAMGLYVSNKDFLEYTSPPVVVGDRIILGSSVADNQSIDTPSGAVRAFDVRTGKALWKWEPLSWVTGPGPHTSGAGNAWAPLAADAEHDLVFVPTGSPSVDYYGGTRVGDNHDADSIVALRASTGEKVWAFQLVHHNLWDYDTASQPLLFTWRGSVPAVAVMNKTGMIYVFNRLTGEPLFPIEERAVPQTEVPGEKTWATQPFSSVEPLLSTRFSVDKMPVARADDERFCERLMREVRYDGPFTPPSMRGTAIYPASLGGPNWGSSALDMKTGVMYTRVNSMAYLVWLSEGATEVDAPPKQPAQNARDQLKAGLVSAAGCGARGWRGCDGRNTVCGESAGAGGARRNAVRRGAVWADGGDGPELGQAGVVHAAWGDAGGCAGVGRDGRPDCDSGRSSVCGGVEGCLPAGV